MAVVRPHRRTPVWLPVALLAGAIVLAALLVAAWLSFRRPAAGTADVSTTAARIATELDVVALSLYTDDTVREGAILQPEEFAAAQSAVRRARTQWDEIRAQVEPTQRARIDDLFQRLDDAIAAHAPASEVQALISELQAALRSLSARSARSSPTG